MFPHFGSPFQKVRKSKRKKRICRWNRVHLGRHQSRVRFPVGDACWMISRTLVTMWSRCQVAKILLRRTTGSPVLRPAVETNTEDDRGVRADEAASRKVTPPRLLNGLKPLLVKVQSHRRTAAETAVVVLDDVLTMSRRVPALQGNLMRQPILVPVWNRMRRPGIRPEWTARGEVVQDEVVAVADAVREENQSQAIVGIPAVEPLGLHPETESIGIAGRDKAAEIHTDPEQICFIQGCTPRLISSALVVSRQRLYRLLLLWKPLLQLTAHLPVIPPWS